MGAAGVRLRAAAVVMVAAAAFGAPHARADNSGPIGGTALGSRGVVVARTQGVPPLPNVSAAAFVVAETETGEVLAARDAHGRYLPASTLKTLTAVALIPQVRLNAPYTVTDADVSIEGSKVGLVAGHRLPVGKLVEAMLVVSGNDAANALAGAAGGMDHAVATMNATAQRLQANDTLARNPSGLDAPGQLTSAYDLALIARAGLAMPAFARYAATLRDTMPAPRGTFEIYNHNKLLPRYRGDIGIKTGFTVAARHTYVGAARRNGHTIVITLLKAETMYPDAEALLDWGFAAAGRTTPVGRLVDPLPDTPQGERADRSRVTPLAADPAAAPVRKQSDHGVPTLPAASAVVATGTVLTLRRRAVRRRSGLRLDLPVR